MAGLALQILFAACCAAPFVIAALHAGLHAGLNRRRAGAAAGWCVAALLAGLASVQADPLSVALRHVDGMVLRGGCGV